jgi:hypothetical protein
MLTQLPTTNHLQPKTANIPQSTTPLHLSSPTGIPQPRQGRHIPTPGKAQRNPGIQTPPQNKPLKGVTLIFSPVHLFSCSPDLFRGDTSSTTHLSHPAGTRNSAILMPYALCLPYTLCPAKPSRFTRDYAFSLFPYALCLMPYALCLKLPTKQTHFKSTTKNTSFNCLQHKSPYPEVQKQTHFRPIFNPFLTHFRPIFEPANSFFAPSPRASASPKKPRSEKTFITGTPLSQT